jgi:hypothetical protein
VPFFNLSGFCEGPIAKALGDVDISGAPGLLVAAVTCYHLMRNVNLPKEQPAIEASSKQVICLRNE